jgi:hypothetical protein
VNDLRLSAQNGVTTMTAQEKIVFGIQVTLGLGVIAAVMFFASIAQA